MPLIHGKSKKAFQENIKTEMDSGKPQKQSLAIAYATKRAAGKKMAKGGMVQKLMHDPTYADGGVIVDDDPYKEGDHIPNSEYYEPTKEQYHDHINHPKEHQADAAEVGLDIERMEHPDVAGMVMKIMQNKKNQMMLAKGGMVDCYDDGGEVQDKMAGLQKGAGFDPDKPKPVDYDQKIKNFFGVGDDQQRKESSYNEGGEIPEPSRSHHPELGFEDSDHEDDDFLSQDKYMNEYMDQVEDSPEVKKKKMLSGIMASIAKENYGRNK